MHQNSKNIPGILFIVLRVSLTVSIMLTFLVAPVKGQLKPPSKINELINSIENNTTNLPIEKVHLQLDKPWYNVGDTIWFKAYIFDATYLNASSTSGIIYVELANDSNHLIKRMMLPASIGIAWGNISLDEKEVPQGSYILRAYTKWMLNFGEDYIFKKRFYISNAVQQPWLANLHKELVKDNGKEKALFRIQLNKSANVPIGARELQIKVMEGSHVLSQDKVTTSPQGILTADFNVPSKKKLDQLSLMLQYVQKGEPAQKVFIPLVLNRPEQTDLQFMPESGSLLNGIPARVGFKAISEDGIGIDISGIIYNNEGKEINRFKAAHKGMGMFELLPQAGELYTASVTLPDGSIKIYPLPDVKSTGTSLRVINTDKSDSVEVLFYCTPDIMAENKGYYIIGQSRGVVCMAASSTPHKNVTRFVVAKKLFPTGIARFTLFSADKQPLNERIIFINQQDNLTIHVSPGKTVYGKRDSVSLSIQVSDKANNPVQASLSLAVTDNNQVTPDSNLERSIVTDMLLTSDLKGTVEEPGYYFNADSHRDLDNLMLTQGWVGYSWKDIFAPRAEVAYKAEHEYAVQGKVTNVFNKPVSNSGVVLLSRKPTLVMDTVTNESGIFTFNNIIPSDTAVYLLQARNKKGKSFNVGIEVEEFKPPVFSNTGEQQVPWYINIDSINLKALSAQLSFKQEKEKRTGNAQMLQEVIVLGKKIIKDSKNLNGPGEADLTLTAEDLNKAGKETLGSLLVKNIKGFGLGGKSGQVYVISGMIVHLVIDGVNVDALKPEGFSQMLYYKNFFDYYTAEDIKGIELMKSGKYQMSYTSEFLSPMALFYEHTFIEITTYSGQGPFLKKLPGIYLYKPLPLSLPRTFYSPKYNIVDSTNDIPDIRSTIHWEPNVVTDKEGKATVSFYTADHAGHYTVVAEGSDMNGSVGECRLKIVIRIPE